VANPIAFRPPEYDPKQGLFKRLEAAPREHAEALLVAYDLLQEAHDQGILDGLHGLVHAKDEIAQHIAEGASLTESVAALRNLVSITRMMAAIEPETLSCVAAAVSASSNTDAEAPSLWNLLKRVTSREGRRGIGILVSALVALGTRKADSLRHGTAKD
jgi:uncharacterized protein YjgD (DUF1641 family)